MEIDLRISDDYCQGEASTLETVDDEFYEEDKMVRKPMKIRCRNRLT